MHLMHVQWGCYWHIFSDTMYVCSLILNYYLYPAVSKYRLKSQDNAFIWKMKLNLFKSYGFLVLDHAQIIIISFLVQPSLILLCLTSNRNPIWHSSLCYILLGSTAFFFWVSAINLKWSLLSLHGNCKGTFFKFKFLDT